MKQTFFFVLIFILSISIVVNAATVPLSFSGVTTEGRYCLLDSVKIVNLTQNWTQTLDCSIDTTFELSVAHIPTSFDNIVEPEDCVRLLSVNHDFAMGNTMVTINCVENDIVRLYVTDMVGRVLIEHAEYLIAGHHQFLLQLGLPQVYMLSVVTNTEHASVKILSVASSGRYGLSRIASLPNTYQPSSRHQNVTDGGDLMQYTGYTNQRGLAVSSQPITQYQSNPENIVFQFAPVAKALEGMYVGMMGFNNALYPYPFDILTSSNLYVHQDFVSNLTMANGTILYHAVYTSLGNIVNAPVPEKLENVSLITFTDGLDIGSWRMNSNYPSETLYLSAVNTQIRRTYIDGIKLDAYAIGVKGRDVTDEVRFESDLHQLASDSANVYSVSNMEEVNARFREIAATIYNTKVNYSMTIKLPAPDPGSIIRFTFDDVVDANNSIYYIEGTYNYDFGTGMGILDNVVYSGIRCGDGTTWTSVPDGIFDVFTIHDLSTNLGERLSTSLMRQWSYIPSTDNWQINSEFDPSSNSSSIEERTSALVMLVLDCSSSLSDDFSEVQTAARNFLGILAGRGNISKPTVSRTTFQLGDLQATLISHISSTGNLSILDKGFCVSEYPNMDEAEFYSCGAGDDDFEYFLTNLIEGKTYYICPYAENHLGRTYGAIFSFIAIPATLPEVSLNSTVIIDADKIFCKGKILFDGRSPIIEKGFCWSTHPNPTIDDNFISVETSNETFNDTIKNLVANTETYYIRAYAKNNKGIGYSSDASNTCISAIFYTADQKINHHFTTADVLRHNFNEGRGAIIFRQQVSNIKDHAFESCAITSVIIPNSVKSIGDYAFRYCADLTSITIPDSVTTIGYAAFYECTGLTSITLGNGVTSIGENAFYRCNFTSITIPNSVTSIEKYTFWYCSNLVSVTIGDGVTDIKFEAFSECTALESVTIGNNVISIGNNAFRGCSSLTSVTIPNSVTNIGEGAFEDCTSLAFATIGDGVTTIGNTAFLSCSALTSITIGNSVNSIGHFAFHNCSNLTSITSKATNPATCGSSSFNGVTKSIPVYVPAESISAYKSATGWRDFPNIQAIID